MLQVLQPSLVLGLLFVVFAFKVFFSLPKPVFGDTLIDVAKIASVRADLVTVKNPARK